MPVVLMVGAGHAHLYVVKRAAQLAAVGYQVHLIAPRFFDYSGVASAAAVGSVPSDVGRIDVRALADACGVEFHEGVLETVDLDSKTVAAPDGGELSWDVLSFNIGSVVDPVGVRLHPTAVTVKPLSALSHLDGRLKSFREPAVTVVGTGASGLELTAQLAGRPDVARVHLVYGFSAIGAELPRRARRRIARLLDSRAVTIRPGCEVSEVGEHEVTCADGTTIAHDVAVVATGLVAPPLLAELGLGDTHGIPVRATLQHVDHDDIYAAGDCAHFVPEPLPRIGVHGVRQGPVLLASLVARIGGGQLPRYEPQRRALSILDLGNGVGLAVRGRWWWFGRTALWLKRYIDRRWLAGYRP